MPDSRRKKGRVMPGRLVVTGQNADGKSVFVSDTELEPITLSLLPGAAFHRLWGSDEPPHLPTNGARPDQRFQNGTRHAWHNRSSEPCVQFVTLLGAVRSTAEVG
jgi:hypothetical protein